MSFVRLTRDNFENIKLTANPSKTFTSSSIGAVGTIALFSDASDVLKDIELTVSQSNNPEANEDQPQINLQNIVSTVKGGHGVQGNTDSLFSNLDQYLDVVNAHTTSYRTTKRQEIFRFVPGVKFDQNFLRKRTIKEVLFPFYQNVFPTSMWAYTNYHSINFVSGGNLPNDSCLIYPAGTGSVALEDYNPLAPNNAFTFEFYINPRYTTLNPGDDYKAGTVLHMSSCYAVSLVSGSSLGLDGKPNKFRLLLQLSSSANIPPSRCSITNSSVTTDMSAEDATWAFVSSDNSLSKNTWHHVAVRWGGTSVNNGTGSFVIDNSVDTNFVITSGSVMQARSYGADQLDPDALFVGNFYEGSNKESSAIALYFNPKAAREEGVINFNANLPESDPIFVDLRHPLNAEVHEIKMFNQHRSDAQIYSSSIKGSSLEDSLLFYVPPFFTKESRVRNIHQTPFFAAKGSSEDPFNIPLSFGVGGLEINLENFVRDFVTKQYPRLWNLTGSTIDTQVNIAQTANDIYYSSGSSRKRNLTILPSDNGNFFPNFDLLSSSPTGGISDAVQKTTTTSSFSGSFDDRFIDNFGNVNYSLITLDNIVPTASIEHKLIPPDDQTIASGSIMTPMIGPTPEDPSVAPSSILTSLMRQKDPSSNEVVIFDISNMFYGDRIVPGSFKIQDLAVSGSGGTMSLKIQDNKWGNLYRADSINGPHATWSSVGNILYDEGLVVIKSPNLPLFGKDSFKVDFLGERNVYTLEVLVPAGPGLFNSSSNPRYQELSPSDYSSETAEKFTYLTGINLHDNNMNIIGRAHLAQPVVKRLEDRIVFRLRMDY
jgi:hypothetical protein